MAAWLGNTIPNGLSVLLAMVLAGGVALPEAEAGPLSNRPFGFRHAPGGGIGMSLGGRQAVLGEALFDRRPDVLVRAPSGALLEIGEAGRGAAVAALPGGGFVPRFRGADYRAGTVGMSVGAFNAFFVPDGDTSLALIPFEARTTDTVNSWTGRVISGSAVAYRTNDPVDVWTALVFGLPRLR